MFFFCFVLAVEVWSINEEKPMSNLINSSSDNLIYYKILYSFVYIVNKRSYLITVTYASKY